MSCQVLVVDDEPGIAMGLKFLIEKMMPECRVIALAFDGQEGCEKAMELNPDIVLTDIRMPKADGIEMIRRLKQAGNSARFIILSGFSEFEYARSAISLGVEEYITKPVEEEELYAVLTRICTSIQEKQKESEDQEALKLTLKNYSRDMTEYVLKDLLQTSAADAKTGKNRLMELGFPLACKWYSCLVLENNGLRPELVKDRFYRLAEEHSRKYLSSFQSQIAIPYSDSLVVLVLARNGEKVYREFMNGAGKVRFAVSEHLGESVSGGVGLMHHKVEQIGQSFEEARCALNYKVMKGLNAVIGYEEIRDITGNHGLVGEADVDRLESCIDSMDEVGIRLVVEEIFQRVQKEKNVSLADLQQLSLNLILSGIKKMPFMQFQLNEYLGRNILSLESIAKFQTIEQLKNWIINTLKSMNELMLKEHMPEKRDVVAEAKTYMNQNFNKEISLNDISERFFINPYYFSQLFKKKTGETYQSYLTGLRVKRAKKLLEETDLKIYEICAMVGYTDTNHFNKVFERGMGIKPGEYRKKQENGT